MRRYNIVSGILLILFIIDFALAAPVLVQEKCQACVDVVHIPRDAITVLGKRADGELEKLAEEFLKTSGKPAESSDVHVSSGSAPSGPGHESTNVAQAPVSNPMSTATSNPSTEPPGPSIESESPALSDSQSYGWLFETQGGEEVHKPLPTPTSSGPSLELSLAPPGHGSTKVVSEPASNPASSTADPLFEPEGGDGSHRPQDTAPPPNPKKRPLTNTNPYQKWDWATLLNRPWPLKKFGQTMSVVHPPSTFTGLLTRPKHDVVHPPFTATGLLTEPKHNVVNPPFTITGLPTELKHDAAYPPFTFTSPKEPKVQPPFTITGLPKPIEREVLNRPPPSPDPQLHLDHQSLTTDSQPVDPLAATQ